VDELRVVGKGCSYPLCPMLFFHSVGDSQRACHANEVRLYNLNDCYVMCLHAHVLICIMFTFLICA